MSRMLADLRDGGKISAWLAAGIFALAAALLGFGTGEGSLGNGDEATYALFARAMRDGDWLHLRLGDFLVHQRPPLYPWLVALSTSVFGETAFALRLPSVLAGAAAAALTYLLGERIAGRRVGVVAGLLFPTLALPFLYGRAVVSDMTLCALVLLSVHLMMARRFAAGGLALGAALMTKQVVGLLPLVALVALAWGRERPSWREVLRLGAAAAVVWIPWHAVMTALHGRAFWDGYLGVNVVRRASAALLPATDATYYLDVLWQREGPLVLAVILGLALAMRGAWARRSGDALLALWFVGVVALFSLASTRIDYYLLPAYPALALLCARPLAAVRASVAAVAGVALVAASAAAHVPQRLLAVDRSAEIRQVCSVAAPAFVVDDLPMAAELYGGRRVRAVVTRFPNYLRVLEMAFLDPTRVLWIPPEVVPAFLAAHPGAVVLEPKAELRHPAPPGARPLAESPRYVLYQVDSR